MIITFYHSVFTLLILHVKTKNAIIDDVKSFYYTLLLQQKQENPEMVSLFWFLYTIFGGVKLRLNVFKSIIDIIFCRSAAG